MKCIDKLNSEDNYPTTKYIFENNGKTVESTYINREEKHIICLSTMYGCPIKCKFCASGLSYFGKLNQEEIINMVNYIIKDKDLLNSNKRILISFMGSGEPLLNLNAIINVIKFLNQNIPSCYFAISVSGKSIDKLDLLINDKEIRSIKPKIQFSLHSPYNEERKKLIPFTEDLDVIIKKLKDYQEKVGKEVDLNYLIFDNINDSMQHAIDLAKLIKKAGLKLKINQYHDVNLGIKESKNKTQFIKYLNEENVYPEIYFTDGGNIQAACGQLTSKRLISDRKDIIITLEGEQC